MKVGSVHPARSGIKSGPIADRAVPARPWISTGNEVNSMAFFKDMFLGIKSNDMEVAKLQCEKLIGTALKCTHSTFCGGVHCGVIIDGSSFDLRLNHHDDGDGWSWCIEDARYPLVFSCTFRDKDSHDRIMARLAEFDLIELPKTKRP